MLTTFDKTTSKPLRFGLLGRSIAYSQSPELYEKWFAQDNIKATFELIDYDHCAPKDIAHLQQEFSGICVTIPYKKTIFDYYAQSPGAFFEQNSYQIGAVNVLRFDHEAPGGPKNVYLINTDALAFLALLQEKTSLIEPSSIKNILILGSGGAAAAAFWAVQQWSLENKITPQIMGVVRGGRNCLPLPFDCFYSFDALPSSAAVDMMINATPLGSGKTPTQDFYLHGLLNKKCLEGVQLVVDWSYGSHTTDLILWAQDRNICYIDGLTLLHQQAIRTFSFWFQKIKEL